ncbi:MAG TPA: M20/M25/M40 family metallo-hydrolase [Phycisphaerales bacterium]|nr:M20/M25/M40 family metallo-hydrolase [Phycisphaerales bacterium]
MSDKHAFLKELLRTGAPTGCERDVQEKIIKRYGEFAERIETDLHGNLYLGINTGAERSVMLAAHCDQIGFMVKHIDDKGFVFLDELGGIDKLTVPGCRVVIHSQGREVTGVIGKKATHEQSESERNKAPTLTDFWVDIGAKDGDEAKELVSVGDYVTYESRITELRNGRIGCPGMDDKAGLYAVLEALRSCSDRSLNVALWVVSTVQEEVGTRGAETAGFDVQPEVGIAVDVTNASDDPGNDKKTTPPCLLGSGPTISHGPNTNPEVERLLIKAARDNDIPYQTLPIADLESNDSKALQVAGSAVAAASIGIPNRNMHTQAEVCDLADIDAAARLLAEFVAGITDDTDFRPLGRILSNKASR